LLENLKLALSAELIALYISFYCGLLENPGEGRPENVLGINMRGYIDSEPGHKFIDVLE